METKIALEKLGTSNYASWSARFHSFLTAKRLSVWLSSAPEPRHTAEEIENASIALAYVRMYVDDRWLRVISGCESAMAAWDMLAAANLAALQPLSTSLQSKLLAIKMKSDETVDAFFNRVEEVQADLERLGMGFPDATIVGVVIRGLSTAFAASSVSLTIQASTYTMVTLRAALVAVESLQESKPSKMFRVEGSRPRRDRSELTCYHCGQKGHVKNSCKLFHESKGVGQLVESTYAPGYPRTDSRPGSTPGVMTCLTASCSHPVCSSSGPWLVDSGATDHMTSSAAGLEDVISFKSTKPVMFGDGKMGDAVGQGTAVIECSRGTLRLERVIIVPGLAGNVISVSTAMRKGVSVMFEAGTGRVNFHREGKCVASAFGQDGLFWLETQHHSMRAAATSSAMSWHERLGHAGYSVLGDMHRQGLIPDKSLPPNAFGNLSPCIPCIQGKMTRASHPAHSQPAPTLLHCISSDVMGPMRVPTYTGDVYNLCVIDAHSSYGVVCQMKAKSQSLSNVQTIIPFLETQSGCRVKRFRSDRGGEFVSGDSGAYFASKGIIQEVTSAYTPEQNGRAERFNRSLMERARTLLVASGLPMAVWGEALHYACDCHNVIPKQGETKSPYEQLFGVPPDLTALQPFGASVWVFIPKKQRHKLQPKAQEGRLLGYEPPLGSHSYRILVGNQVLISCDVFFQKPSELDLAEVEGLESTEEGGHLGVGTSSQAVPAGELSSLDETLLATTDEDPSLPSPGGLTPPATPGVPDSPPQVCTHPPVNGVQIGSTSDPLPASDDEGAVDPVFVSEDGDPLPEPLPYALGVIDSSVVHMQSSAAARALVRRGAQHAVLKAQVLGLEPDPVSVTEALARPDAHAWQTAINDELASLMQHNCWTLVPLPPGARAVGSRIILERKRDLRYKARLVAQGFSQRSGVDYDDTYAPVSGYTTLRSFLAVVAAQDLEMLQLDIKTAFLNGELEEVVYMRQPHGYSIGPSNLVCRLHKAIYGLKQAPRAWHLTLKQKLLEHGFVTSDADPSLFLLSTPEGKRVMILIYVDDCLIAGQKREWVTDAVKLVQSLFEARDMGEPTDFLGMRISRDRSARTLRLHQEPYVAKLLDTFGVAGATPITLPLKAALIPAGEPLSSECHVQYPSLVGSLMHLANCTRPDISQAVSSLARFLKSPTTLHWDAAQQLLRYLVGTQRAGLLYGSGKQETFLGYCDANHGGDVATRRSTTGFVFLLHGAAVSWQSKLQPTVALSTTEAEYQAAGMAAREALWFRKLLPELGEMVTGPSIILCDSESVRALLRNPMTTQRSKHIDIIHHFCRERVLLRQLQYDYVNTNDNLADCLTKPVPRPKLLLCASGMGLDSQSEKSEESVAASSSVSGSSQ
jgi:hypothetical protein